MKKILMHSYDRDAINYDKKFKHLQFLKYTELLGPDASLLKDKNTILDHGCGTGLLHDFLTIKNALPKKYTGIDFSEGMLRIAYSRNLNVVKGEINSLPFVDYTFDVIVSFTVIKIIENDEQMILKEAHRVLQKDGLFIISLLSNRYDNTFKQLLQKTGFRIDETIECGQDIGFICYKQ